MTALMPRLFGDLTDWLDAEFPLKVGHMIRLEDHVSETEYKLRAELPGLDPEKNIHVSVSHGVLTIHAERREHEQARGRSEFRYGTLERSVRLPVNADDEHIAATYVNGILEVTVPLGAPEPVGRQVPIARSD